jgi:hypothetical protein
MKSLEMKPKEPEEQRAMSFIDGLDRRSYHTLQVDLMNRPTEMPKTLAAAYDKAANWVVTVSRTAESYVSDHRKDKGDKGKSRPKGERTSGGKGRDTPSPRGKETQEAMKKRLGSKYKEPFC